MTVLMVPADKQNWPTLGPEVCDWIESNLVFGPGDLRGQPARLDDEKRALVYRAYEVFSEGHPEAGRRRFKRVSLSLRKGVAKTELAAWLAACELADAPVRCIDWKRGRPVGGPVTDPFIPLMAVTEEQSEELAYGTLKAILEEGPLRDDFDIGLERILRKRGDGRAVAVATAPNARDGARTTFQVFDETHRLVLPNQKRAHQTMLANIPKRKIADAWSLEVTTAHQPGEGSIAEDTHEYAHAVNQGKVKDSRLFFFHRQASDSHDLSTEEGAREAVIEASGPSAEWSDIGSIVELWRDPTTDRNYWERVWTNRPTTGVDRAFDVEAWKRLVKDGRIPDKALVTLGFDGARSEDSTGLVAMDVETGHIEVLGLWEKPFGNAGENWIVPYDDVDTSVGLAFDRFNVWRLYADPYQWESYTAKWAGQFGERVVEWATNRPKHMSLAISAFQTAIQTGDISHDGNAVLSRHLGNAHKHPVNQRDDQGQPLYYIRKERKDSPHKIDLAMAAVLANEARNDAISTGALMVRSGPGIWI